MEISSDGSYLRHKELSLVNPDVNSDEDSDTGDEAEQKVKKPKCEDIFIL